MAQYIGSINVEHESEQNLAVLTQVGHELTLLFRSAEGLSEDFNAKGLMWKFSLGMENRRNYVAFAELFDDYVRNTPVIESLFLVRNGRIVFERGPALDSDIPQYPDEVERSLSYKGIRMWALPRKLNGFFPRQSTGKVLPFYHAFKSRNAASDLVLFVGLNETKLCERYSSYSKGSSFLVDNTGTIISATEKDLLGTPYPVSLLSQFKDNGYFRAPDKTVVMYVKGYNDWYLVSHVPLELYQNNRRNLYFIVFLAIILGICFASACLIMQREVYISKIYSQEAALKMLTSQINPHFLYNTLDSIHWKAVQNKDMEVSDQIEALADLFRHVLSKGAEMVTLKQEITQLENYLYIMNFRYGDRIKCTITSVPELWGLKVPKLILQPIVENSIVHGLEPQVSAGEIDICIETRGNLLYIIIRDNGAGTDGDAITKMLNSKEVSHDVFALKNIDQRIKLRYGDSYGMIFASAPGHGTVVTLIMPLEEKR